MNVIGPVLLFLLLIGPLLSIAVLGFMWRVWWLFPAWAWFIVPLGVPNISYWHLVALFALVNAVTKQHEYKKDTRELDKYAFVGLLLEPIFMWLILRWLHV